MISTLDQVYYQVKMFLDDIQKTATPFGLFDFLRMPFGLCKAGLTFQQMMHRVLSGLPFIFVVLNKIREVSPDHATQKQHLHERMVSPSSIFGQEEVKFLGHLV